MCNISTGIIYSLDSRVYRVNIGERSRLPTKVQIDSGKARTQATGVVKRGNLKLEAFKLALPLILVVLPRFDADHDSSGINRTSSYHSPGRAD